VSTCCSAALIWELFDALPPMAQPDIAKRDHADAWGRVDLVSFMSWA
jgi:hypothetical protein